MEDSRFITRVVLKNYKSIAACNVELGPLMFLVGPNGSGKSNFLDALRFVADALRYSLEHALRDRGGISEVRRRSSGHPNNFGCSGVRPAQRFRGLVRLFASAPGRRAGMRFKKKSASPDLHCPPRSKCRRAGSSRARRILHRPPRPPVPRESIRIS